MNCEQHNPSPFIAFSDKEKDRLKLLLTKPLGPEWLSHRSGAGGRLTYIEGKTAINLANELFGFNGWSSELRNFSVDFIDENEHGRVTLCVSVTIRITLKDGTYHEDVGCGSAENLRSKASAFEKAKKEACTDGMKRALRMFGNALGNCIYDKNYLSHVGRMAQPTIAFSPTNLYRHEQFQLPKDNTPPKSNHAPTKDKHSTTAVAAEATTAKPVKAIDPMTLNPPVQPLPTHHREPPVLSHPQKPATIESRIGVNFSEDSFTFDDDIEDTALMEMAEVHDKVDLELPHETVCVKQEIDLQCPITFSIPTSSSPPQANGYHNPSRVLNGSGSNLDSFQANENAQKRQRSM